MIKQKVETVERQKSCYRARRREISTEHSELPGNYSRQEMSVDSSGGKDMRDWMTQEGNKDNR